MVANSDGSGEKVLGGEGELPWASWSPDGKEFACLSLKGVSFVDAATGKVTRVMKRSGFFQQLTWSPDGEWLSGVSNAFGSGWSVARMNAKTGEVNGVSVTDNCTPDWFPDGGRMIFSNRHSSYVGLGKPGWTQCWMAGAGGQKALVGYCEDGARVSRGAGGRVGR